MACAVIVFYLLGYGTESKTHPPIHTTSAQAYAMVNDTSYISIWYSRGVYPVVHPCA